MPFGKTTARFGFGLYPQESSAAEGILQTVSTSLPRSAIVLQNSGVVPADRAAEARSPWVWWHLLSLDAPTVTATWCWFFGAVFGLHFSFATLPTLALGTWSVYVADRLLDGWRATDMVALRDRHWFYLRHRRVFSIAWAIAAIPLAYLIFFRVQPAVRTDDVILCLIGIAYFVLIHGRPSHGKERRSFLSNWISKELTVGFLFAIATAVPAWARLHADRNLLIAAIFTFGMACWLNCVAIQTWEDAEASREIVHTILSGRTVEQEEQRSKGLTQFLGTHLTAFAIVVGLFSAGFATATVGTSVCLLFVSVTVSAGLFLALIRSSDHFSALTLRIAADTALLTPLLFWLRVR